MKKIFVTFLMLGAFFLITLGSASANTFTYSDLKGSNTVTVNWPDSLSTTTAEYLGSPKVDSIQIVTYNDNSLDKIILKTNLWSSPNQWDSLYINSNYEGPSTSYGSDWQSWDYYVEDVFGSNSITSTLYEVGDAYTYSLVTKSGERKGHVNRITSGLTDPMNIVVTYDGTYLTYQFDAGQIVIDDKFIIGYTEWCANDVVLTPPTSVPEPTQMLLLGTALIGLAGIGRKKFFKK